ncbi:hypothetical protein A2U01_0052521, partial [Trifolium medium]|nr:hypothetical protein [Trifolium medium]
MQTVKKKGLVNGDTAIVATSIDMAEVAVSPPASPAAAQ